MSECCEALLSQEEEAAREDAREGSINLLNESKPIQHLSFGKPFNPKHLTRETVLRMESGRSSSRRKANDS